MKLKLTTTITDQGPVSRKSRNFSGVFRVTQFSLYLQNKGVSRHETLQLFLFLFPLQHMKRPALQNKQVVVLRPAFRARKVLGTFEKRVPGLQLNTYDFFKDWWYSPVGLQIIHFNKTASKMLLVTSVPIAEHKTNHDSK